MFCFFLKRFLKIWFRLTQKDPNGNLSETVLELIEQDSEQEGAAFDADERALLDNVLNLKDHTVRNISIPRAEIVMLPHTASADEILNLMIEKKMSQLIIYKEELDNILGYVTLEDIVECYKNPSCTFDIDRFLRPLDFIAPSMQVLDCLLTMREKGQKMAIIVDEYGGVDGLVTFTDVIEEIVGDIQEVESINPPGKIVIKENGDVVVDGHVRLEEINETLGTNFQTDNEDVTTIAGFVCDEVGRLPSKGELIAFKEGIEFLILDASPRKVLRVTIRNLKLIKRA